MAIRRMSLGSRNKKLQNLQLLGQVGSSYTSLLSSSMASVDMIRARRPLGSAIAVAPRHFPLAIPVLAI